MGGSFDLCERPRWPKEKVCDELKGGLLPVVPVSLFGTVAKGRSDRPGDKFNFQQPQHMLQQSLCSRFDYGIDESA